MLIEMKSEETSVLISDGDDYWIDRVAIGSNHFTRSLMEGLSLTFPKAEHLKRNATKRPSQVRLFGNERDVQRLCGEAASVGRSLGIETSGDGDSIGPWHRPGIQACGAWQISPQNLSRLVLPRPSLAIGQRSGKSKRSRNLPRFQVMKLSQRNFRRISTTSPRFTARACRRLGLTELKTSLAWPRQTWSERWDRAGIPGSRPSGT